MSKKSSQSPKGLRQFVDSDQQDAWLEGRAELADAGERQDSIEQRMRYAPRFQKLLRRPQAPEIFGILELYGQTCLPMPRATERYYWSVSCLPSTSAKPLEFGRASCRASECQYVSISVGDVSYNKKQRKM